jgi:hypothetical protein
LPLVLLEWVRPRVLHAAGSGCVDVAEYARVGERHALLFIVYVRLMCCFYVLFVCALCVPLLFYVGWGQDLVFCVYVYAGEK